VILDEKAFCNDFINLAHSIGAYLYEDLLCIVSLRYQTVHILQIRDSGNLVEVRRIGAFCREDDELFLHSHAQVSADVILQLCWIFKYFTSFILIWYRVVIYI
jgi:de-etiolated-1